MSEKCVIGSNLKPVTVKAIKPVRPVRPVRPTELFKPVRPIIPAGPAGLIYIPNLLSVDEHKELLSILENDSESSDDWKTAGHRANRLVRHYGYNYPYTAKQELTLADPIPSYMLSIIQKLRTTVPELADFNADQAIINRYLTGEGIGPHVDHTELFGNTVVSVSIGCETTMRFKKAGDTFDQIVKPRSAYAMTGDSRYGWTHEMPKSKRQCATRFSITFREVELKYLKLKKGQKAHEMKRTAVKLPVKAVKPVKPVKLPVKPAKAVQPLQLIYYGEMKCEAKYGSGDDCRNNAYFEYDSKYLCGVHSKKYEGKRVQLPKNPNKGQIKKDEQELRDKNVESEMKKNKKAGRAGDVILRKLKMMAGVPHVDGYQSVLPNFKHGGRKDALGLSGLSPKSLGPVNHVMPNLPPAATIEDYHQQAKFWSFELDSNGSPTEEAFEARIAAYIKGSADRHKHSKDVLKKYSKTGNINVPEYSIFYDPLGNEHRYTYLECRYFYCHYFELLAGTHPQFQILSNLRKGGTNLNIIGYDSYPPTDNYNLMYLDTSKPFGHELVLYCMLVQDHPADYPWNQYRSAHSGIYKNMF